MGSFHKARKWIVPALIKRHGDRCCYCGIGLTADVGQPSSRTLDHVIPRALGGSNYYLNLMLACSGCNQAKGAMTPLDFIASRHRSTPNGRPMEDVPLAYRVGRAPQASRPVDGRGPCDGPVRVALAVC